MPRRVLRPFCAGLLLAASSWGFAASGDGAEALLVEDVVLDVGIGGRHYSLEALIVKPGNVAGRLPIALLAHGSPRDRADRPKYHARAILPQARDLAHRGWMVVAFMRRGFGSSQGPFAEGYECEAPDFRRALDRAAEDIEAVRAVVVQRPDADGTRVLGLGASAGAAALLAWAATRPDGLVGVVNVSGGSGALTPERNCDEAALVSVFASFGARARVPTHWIYAENDSYFGPALVRRLHSAFTGEGGDAELTMLGSVGQDGHRLWDQFDGRKLWLPVLDEFLRSHALPTWDPRPLVAVSSPLDRKQRGVLAKYLSAPGEKALSISSRRRLAWFWAGADTLQSARQKSLEGCERDSGERCEVAVENFRPNGGR